MYIQFPSTCQNHAIKFEYTFFQPLKIKVEKNQDKDKISLYQIYFIISFIISGFRILSAGIQKSS